MMSEANLTRLVSKLTQMRGAALKVGQFLSIQGPMPSHPHTSLSLTAAHRYARPTARPRPRLPPRARQRALHAQLADGGAHRTHI